MTNRGDESSYPTTENSTLGMTIREKIAAQHSAALAASFFQLPQHKQEEQEKDWFNKYGEIALKEAIVKDAIELTDALIEELSKPINP